LPEPFSGDSSASRGVDSNAATAWQCAAEHGGHLVEQLGALALGLVGDVD
jgi:hypothetical protein